MDEFDREDLRQDFLLALPPPFALDPLGFRIRTDGPNIIRWDWTKEWQGFSQDAVNFLVKEDDQFPYTQDGPLEDYQQALNDLDAAIAVASNLDWNKEPVIGRAWCHREITGTVCALHRWNARINGDPDSIVVGRLQCWNDPNLIETDPTFVQEHPEFQDVVDAEFEEGSVCMLELQSHVFGLGCPPGLVFVASDHVIIEENWDVDWEIAIGATDSAIDTLNQMRILLAELVISKQPYQEL